MKQLLQYITTFMLLCPELVSAQEQCNIKFGKVSPEDFTVKTNLDNSAGAIVIADIGATYYEPTKFSGYDMVYRRFRRVLITDSKATSAASLTIVLRTDGSKKEELENLEGATFNLEGKDVIKTKLDKSTIFNEKYSNSLSTCRITMPAVKPGSIIEFSYNIRSPYVTGISPWQFQEQYPVLWSEYNAEIPRYFAFKILKQGNDDYYINTNKPDPEMGITKLRWVRKDVAPLKNEPYASASENLVSKLSFQFSGLQPSQGPFKPYLNSWKAVTKMLMADTYFGKELVADNAILDKYTNRAKATSATQLGQAKYLYRLVCDSFSCMRADQILKSVKLEELVAAKKGNNADLNLLLVALLRHARLDADPVILSTRSNGEAVDFYPMLTQYNYVLCRTVIDGNPYYLDASTRNLGFGTLKTSCYNGLARIINEDHPDSLDFQRDTLVDNYSSFVRIVNNAKDHSMAGNAIVTMGTAGSTIMRIDGVNEKKEATFKGIAAKYPFDIMMSNTMISDNIADAEPVALKYKFNFSLPADSLLYFSPMLADGIRENIFKAPERTYPVEMPYLMNQEYGLDFELPAGYKVESLPESVKYNLNDSDGTFTYQIESVEGHINLSATLHLNKATFQPEQYSTLRQFFAGIISKEAEQVVLKKM